MIELSTTVVLALAANTSFGGLPMLTSLLARDNLVAHVFGLRGDRPVFCYGVVVLALLSGALLVAVDADTNALIALFATGVFTGFTLSQAGLVRHWWRQRPRHWRARVALNGLGAAMTGVATLVFVFTKFTAGAWVVVIAIPTIIVLFVRVADHYRDVAVELGIGETPPVPKPQAALVVVAVTAVSKMTAVAPSQALALGEEVAAVSVRFDDEGAAALRDAWDRWQPGVRRVVLRPELRSITKPMLAYLNSAELQPSPRSLPSYPRSSQEVAAPAPPEPARRHPHKRASSA